MSSMIFPHWDKYQRDLADAVGPNPPGGDDDGYWWRGKFVTLEPARQDDRDHFGPKQSKNERVLEALRHLEVNKTLLRREEKRRNPEESKVKQIKAKIKELKEKVWLLQPLDEEPSKKVMRRVREEVGRALPATTAHLRQPNVPYKKGGRRRRSRKKRRKTRRKRRMRRKRHGRKSRRRGRK